MATTALWSGRKRSLPARLFYSFFFLSSFSFHLCSGLFPVLPLRLHTKDVWVPSGQAVFYNGDCKYQLNASCGIVAKPSSKGLLNPSLP